MVTEKEFDEILKEKGLMEQCRKIWWKRWEQYQAKFGGDKESLEKLVTTVIEKGCKAPCGL